jgi:hypothetical protein
MTIPLRQYDDQHKYQQDGGNYMGMRFCLGRRLLAAAIMCATLGAGLAGYGTASAATSSSPLSGLSADQIATKAVADLKAASTVHVTGDVSSSGQTYDLDLTLVRAQGCTGTMAVAGTGSFKLIAIGNQVWIKPDQQFWQKEGATAAVLNVVSGKYLKVKATSQLGSLSGFCQPSQLAGSFGRPAAGLVKGTTTTISGQQALQIKDTGDSASILVSDTAKPQILRLSGGSQGTIDFSSYNSPVTLTAPPAADTLDGAKYGL